MLYMVEQIFLWAVRFDIVHNESACENMNKFRKKYQTEMVVDEMVVCCPIHLLAPFTFRLLVRTLQYRPSMLDDNTSVTHEEVFVLLHPHSKYICQLCSECSI